MMLFSHRSSDMPLSTRIPTSLQRSCSTESRVLRTYSNTSYTLMNYLVVYVHYFPIYDS